MTRFGTVLVTLALALPTTLSACGGEEPPAESAPAEDSSRPSEPAEDSSPSEERDCESLLSDQEAADLVGEDVGTAERGHAGDLPACQWGSPTAGVQVIDLSADDWIEQLPELIKEFRSSGVAVTPEQQDRLDEGVELARSADGATPDEACEVFSTMAEIQGEKAGADSLVTLLPNRQEPEVVSAQACADGRFQSVTFAQPDLAAEVDAAVANAQDALVVVQGNAG